LSRLCWHPNIFSARGSPSSPRRRSRCLPRELRPQQFGQLTGLQRSFGGRRSVLKVVFVLLSLHAAVPYASAGMNIPACSILFPTLFFSFPLLSEGGPQPSCSVNFTGVPPFALGSSSSLCWRLRSTSSPGLTLVLFFRSAFQKILGRHPLPAVFWPVSVTQPLKGGALPDCDRRCRRPSKPPHSSPSLPNCVCRRTGVFGPWGNKSFASLHGGVHLIRYLPYSSSGWHLEIGSRDSFPLRFVSTFVSTSPPVGPRFQVIFPSGMTALS